MTLQLLRVDQYNRAVYGPKYLLLLCPADLNSSHVAVITMGGLVWVFIHFPVFGCSFLPSSEECTQTKLSKGFRTLSLNVQSEEKMF